MEVIGKVVLDTLGAWSLEFRIKLAVELCEAKEGCNGTVALNDGSRRTEVLRPVLVLHASVRLTRRRRKVRTHPEEGPMEVDRLDIGTSSLRQVHLCY